MVLITLTGALDTPIASSNSKGATSDIHIRCVNISPRCSYDSFYEENLLEETAKVEAVLNDINQEFKSTEDMLTEWSCGSLSGGPTYTSTTTLYVISLNTYTIYNCDGNRLSTISECTKNIPLHPTSYGACVTAEGHRLSTHPANTASPGHTHTWSVTNLATEHVSGQRMGNLISFFKDRASTPKSSFTHTRTLSMPGYHSHSPFHPISQSTPHMGIMTRHDTSTGYTSHPSLPTKSKAGSTISSASSVLDSLSMFSLLAPPTRGSTTYMCSSTQLSSSDFTSIFSNTLTTLRTMSNITSTTPPVSILCCPQLSPQSLLTSVHNLVVAWKECTPSLSKTPWAPTESTASPPSKAGKSSGLDRVFSLRWHGEQSDLHSCHQNGQFESEDVDGSHHSTTPKSMASSIIPPPFDMTELGGYARDHHEASVIFFLLNAIRVFTCFFQQPLQLSVLWYLIVHSGPPYRWQHCEAPLYPHMLLLSWIAPGGGRGVVMLDLLDATEVHLVPSPMHSSARKDVGTIATKVQITEGHNSNLLKLLCPFQLLYSNGMERLAVESTDEQVCWVSAI